MENYRQFNFLFGQKGNSIFVTDRSEWDVGELSGWQKDSTAILLVDTVDEVALILDTSNPASKSFFIAAEVAEEHHIRLYAVEVWVTTTVVTLHRVYWYNGYAWISNVNGNASEPSLTNPEWTVLTTTNLSTLESSSAGVVKTDGYASTILSLPQGDFIVEKTGDHEFVITNRSGSDIDESFVLDYRGDVIQDNTPAVDADSVTVSFDEDGVYSVVIILTTGTVHYIEVYDFTDSEECYRKLTLKVLCDCSDCNCTSPLYDKALTFATIYQMIKEIVYSDRYIYAGLMSTTSIRSDMLTELGTLVKKLSTLRENCTCND